MKLADIVNGPWMITPSMLEEIQQIYSVHLRGEKIDLKAVEARIGKPLDNEQKSYETVNGTAVIPVHGVISQRMNLFSRISGGTSSQQVQQQVQEALDDPYVDKLLLHIDSPGGAVAGVFELADFIYQARGQKPITAFTDGMMASAGYLLGSAADKRFISSEATDVGSIGVITKHNDISAQQEKSGVKTTVLTAGQYKGTGHQHAPLSEDDRGVIQGQLDHLYTAFVNTVARNLDVSAEKVTSDMAEGREFIGSQAIEAGLVNGMCTMDELCAPSDKESYLGYLCSIEERSGIQASTRPEHHQPAVAGVPAAKGAAMNLQELKEQHPQLAQELITEGMTLGAGKERARILAIQGIPATGHKEIVSAAIEDGTSTAGDVALAVMNKERVVREGRLAGMITDSIQPAAQSEGAEVTVEEQKSASLVGAMVAFAQGKGRA